jgi:type II secretory pathway component PulF
MFKAMVYKIKVNKEKTAAFYQMLQSLRKMGVVDSIEILDDSYNDESMLEGVSFHFKDKRQGVNTLEMMKKYSDLVDLD